MREQKYNLEPLLQHFSIIDTTELKSESDQDLKNQILYYYPTIDLKLAGLVLGIGQFMNQFNTQIQIIKTLKSKVVILVKKWIFVCKIRMPIVLIDKGKKFVKYGDIQDSLCLQFLDHIVNRFFLLYQTPNQDISLLDYYTTLDFGIRGMSFAQFDSRTNRIIISLISRIQTKINSQLMLLYKDSVCSTDIQDFSLYDYLTSPTTGTFYDGFVNQVKEKGLALISHGRGYTGYLIGPLNGLLNPKKVHVMGKDYTIVVYQLDFFTFCFLVDEEASMDWYKHVERTIRDVCKDVRLEEGKQLAGYSYLCYNRMTLRIQRSSNSNMFDFLHQECGRELVIRLNDGWVVGQTMNDRDVYVVIEEGGLDTLQGIRV